MIAFNLILTLVLGLIVGSFLSMLIPRLHYEEKGIFFGRSHCSNCKKTLAARDLIPLFSFLINGGKCRFCKKKVSIFYPSIELTTALTFVALCVAHTNLVHFVISAFFFTILIFIFFYDLRFQEIHDGVMLPAILIAAVLVYFFGDIYSSLIAAAIAVFFFGGQYVISKGKWIGIGDLRIGIFMGLMLGWQKLLIAIFIAYILGSIIGLSLIALKKAGAKTAVPLGPFLVIGAAIAYFFGDQLIRQYYLFMI